MILLAWCAMANDGEGLRLTEELITLVKTSRWAGVERTYTRILTQYPTSLTAEVHLVGAQAARQQGNFLTALQRLGRIDESDPMYTSAHNEVGGLLETTGLVAIHAAPGTKFDRTTPPFAPDSRAAIASASQAIETTGLFVGLLPVGEYKLGEATHQLPAGPNWTVFDQTP